MSDQNRIEELQQALEAELAAKVVQVSVKNVYGNLMVYPANQVAHDLADLLGVKTFTNKARDQLKKLGYEFVRVNNDGVKL